MKKLIVLAILLSTIIIQAQTYKFGKVSMDELTETSCALDPTAPAAILYNERISRYTITDGSFFIEDTYFIRIKIYKTEGFKYASEKIHYFPTNENVYGLKAVTYNIEKGKIIETDLDKKEVFTEKTTKFMSRKNFTMPNLKEGSVVEWTYTKQSPSVVRLDDVELQKTIPIKKNHISIKIPEYLVYKPITKGYLHIPMKMGSANNSTYNFSENTYNIDMDNVPSLKEENYCGNIDNYLSGIAFEITMTKFPGSLINNFSSDWNKVIKEINDFDGFGVQLKQKNYFEDDLVTVLSGKISETEKINAVFKHVKSKIKDNDNDGYTTDVGVKKSYKEGAGNIADINFNLIILLRAAGLDANPVLVSTIDNGIPLFPSYYAFDYIVVAVNTAQGKIMLDASGKNNAVNVLPEKALNFFGKEVKPDGSYQDVTLYPTKHSVSKTIITVNFKESIFEGNSRTTFSDNLALNYRDDMSEKTKEVQQDEINKKYENIDVLNARINNLDDHEKEVSEDIKFETELYFEEISGKTYITPLFFKTESDNIFKTEKRVYPIYFNHPWVKSTLVNLSIPENYTVEMLPEEQTIALPNDLGGFQFKATQNQKTIQIQSTIVINQPVVQASDYQIIKDFYKDIITKQAEKIVLVKK